MTTKDDDPTSNNTSLPVQSKQQCYGSTTEANTSDETKGTEDESHHHSGTGSTFALCLCTLTHAYLSVSVFPYAGFMAIELIPNGLVNEENAGSFAGLIASSFMVGRFISSYWWGKIADTYGRIFCLIASLLWSCTFVLLFGLATNFWHALMWRFCLGLGNGMVGTAKTTVSELAKGNSRRETTAMGWLIAMWGLAGLIGPALGGLLAEPIQQYPQFWSKQDAHWMIILRDFLNDRKFLLPNLIGSIFCVIAIVAISLFVEETLPDYQRRSITQIPNDLAQLCIGFFRKYCTCSRGANTNDAAHEEEGERLPLVNGGLQSKEEKATKEHQPEKAATIASLWSRRSTRQHLLVYWGGSFVGVAADEIFPLFCISQQAGLGLQERGIGKILSLGALVFVILQYPIYSKIVHTQGLYPSIRIGLLVTIPLILILPTILLVDHVYPPGGGEGGLSWQTLVYSTTLLAIYRVFGLIFFSSIQVALNRTVPDHQRATLNGFDMLGNSAVKSIGPFLAGVLFSFCVSSGIFSRGINVILPFAVVSAFGFLLTWATFHLEEPAAALAEGEEEEAAAAEEESNSSIK